MGVAEVDNLSRSNDMVVKQDDEDKAEVAFSTVFTFGIAFWVLTVSCVVVYGALYLMCCPSTYYYTVC